ncbi:hypothetical protein JW916_13425 [Candidatus Sumerlaeota bacterium]|nr:hypothetical protein [Candidatus Sumerlaeota bacterium]
MEQKRRSWLEPLLNPAVVLLLVLLAWGLSDNVAAFRRYSGLDYYIFWVYAQAARESPLEDIYGRESTVRLGQKFYDRAVQAQESLLQLDAALDRKILIPVSTPFLFASFGPIVTGRYELDIRVYQILSLAVALAAVAFMARSLGFGAVGILAAMAYFARAYEPLQIDIEHANVNRLQLGMIGLLCWVLSKRPERGRVFLAAGMVLGGILAFKPNLALVFVLLVGVALVDGRFSKAAWIVAGVAIGAGVAVAASSLYFGSLRCWIEWIVFFPSFVSREVSLQATNRSLAQALRTWTGFNLSGVLLAALLISAFAAAVSGRRGRVSAASPVPIDNAYSRDFAAVALGCAIPLVSGPLAWQHYLTLMIPLVLYEIRPEAPRSAEHGDLAILRRMAPLAALAAVTVWPAATEWFYDTQVHAIRYAFASTVCVLLGIWHLGRTEGPRASRVSDGPATKGE